MVKWKLNDFLKELETRIWEECGTIYKLGGIGRYNGPNGMRTYDCVGVFKSILWNYPYEPQNYNKTYPDVNVGGMKKRCTKIMPFDESKMKPGMLVFINTEHIGMVGDPQFFKEGTSKEDIIYESTPAFLNCLQRTSVKARANRPWTHMAYADFIDYGEDNDLEKENAILKEKLNSINEYAEKILELTKGQ